MTVFPSRNKTILSQNGTIHILLTLHHDDGMPLREGSQGSGRKINRHRSGDDLAPQAHHGASHRPTMAIQDMLNPVGNEKSGIPRANASTARANINARSSTGHNDYVQYPRRASSSSSSSGHPRTSSVSSRSSSTRDRRQHRPQYLEEEVYFIWYHRIDLGYEWQDITNAYNAQFPDRKREGFGGIQCKYYRYCEEFGIPKVRHRNRAASQVDEYGMRARTGLLYSWMRN